MLPNDLITATRFRIEAGTSVFVIPNLHPPVEDFLDTRTWGKTQVDKECIFNIKDRIKSEIEVGGIEYLIFELPDFAVCPFYTKIIPTPSTSPKSNQYKNRFNQYIQYLIVPLQNVYDIVDPK